MRINTNVSALNTQRILGQTNDAAARSIGRLSSGFRINRAADDAAGLAIANKMRADIRSLNVAARNAEQTNSILQVMEGSASTVSSILERMKELATQAASDNVAGSGRTQISEEFGKLQEELDRIVDTTEFQGQKLLTGAFGTTVTVNDDDMQLNPKFTAARAAESTPAATYTLSWVTATDSLTVTSSAGGSQTVVLTAGGEQTVEFGAFGLSVDIGATFALADADIADVGDVVVSSSTSGGQFLVGSSGDYAGNDLISLDSIDIDGASLGVDSGSIANLNSISAAQSALTAIDSAIDTLNTSLGKIGAAQNRVDFALQNVRSSIENFAAAESTIRDVDMAAEMTEFTKQQILQQAGTAMLAQANAAPQSVLRLLQ